VSARKKSEEVQELAADAHRNLEHALPSLEAALTAVAAIERAEFVELRAMKSPPEVLKLTQFYCILFYV